MYGIVVLWVSATMLASKPGGQGTAFAMSPSPVNQQHVDCPSFGQSPALSPQ